MTDASQPSTSRPFIARTVTAVARPTRAGFLLTCAALGVALGYVLCFAVDVPFWDDWELVHQLQMLTDGTLRAQDVWALHNEHRNAVPRLVMFGLVALSGYDTVAQSLFTVTHLAILLAYAYLWARRSCGWPRFTAPLWFVTVAFLLLGLRQHENLLWGFQIGLTLPLTCGFAGLFHLHAAVKEHKIAPAHVAVAVLAGAAGSFSSAMGLLVWPCGAVVLGMRWRTLPWRRGLAITWLLASVAV
jgi:hypothetical protein